MPRRRQSKGKCVYCGAEMAKSGAARHLTACRERRTSIETAEKKDTASETLYHLRAADAYGGGFWLDLEVPGSSTLGNLDDYLRTIWLECCDHLSQFSVGGWRGEEIPMDRRIDQVFRPGVELTHIYDFGTSSFTLVKYVGEREGKPTNNRPIALMVRNLLPEAVCTKCGKPAQWLCMGCQYDVDEPGTLCDQHARRHSHSDFGGPIPLANSPRVGMCGYVGPAEPPY